MKNNLMLFFAVFFLLAGISRGNGVEDMFKELKKSSKNSKKESEIILKDVGGIAEKSDIRKKEDIMQVVNARMPALRSIYKEHLKQKPGFSGKVVLKFTIAASGEITNIDIISSTTGYAKFDKAIKDNIATWKWEAIESGNVTPTIPFNFTEDDSWDI